MYSLLICILLALYARQQGNIFLGLLLIPSVFFYYLAYELKDSELSTSYFEFAVVNDYSLYALFGLALTFSTIVALHRRISGSALELVSPPPMPPTHIKRATTTYYLLSSIATLAFIFNLFNVNFDISLLFLNPRAYEETFGKITAVNYLYFLNIPALCISIYLKQQLKQPRAAKLINFTLISMSFFHGIKFTVFDTLLLPALFYFHCSRKPQRALLTLGITISVLLVFYIAFSFGVRGFSDNDGPIFAAILNYILPNYYNFAYAIQLQPLQFDPLSFVLPDKIPNPILPILPIGELGFILNDKFNMPTAYATVYSALPIFSWLLFIPMIARIRLRVIHHKLKNTTLQSVFLVAYIDFCLFFFWYFFAFNKTKYVYYLIIMTAIGFFIHRYGYQQSKVNRIRAKIK